MRACRTYDEALDTTCRSCSGTTRIVDSWNEHDPEHGFPMLRQRHECLHCSDAYERIHQVPLQYRNHLWDALGTGARLMSSVTVQSKRAVRAIGLTSAR